MSADALAGTGLYDLQQLTTSVADGHWVASGLHGLTAGIEGVSLLADPFGTLATWGVGWVIEHLQPLAGWYDNLAGEPDLIRARAQTAYATATGITALADRAADATRTGLAASTGLAVARCQTRGHEIANELAALGRATHALGIGLEKAAAIVEGVRSFLRDCIAELVTWVGKQLFGLVGAATLVPDLVELVGTKVPYARRVFEALTTSMSELSGLLQQLSSAVAAASAVARKLAGQASVPVQGAHSFLNRQVAATLTAIAAEAGLGMGARVEDDARNRPPEPSPARVPHQARQAPTW